MRVISELNSTQVAEISGHMRMWTLRKSKYEVLRYQ